MSVAHVSSRRVRLVRASLAFLVVMSTVVFIPSAPTADAAGDDLAITSSVDSTAIFHGAVSSWSLEVSTSEDATLADSIVVTNTLPDGLCPFGAGDGDCAGGVAPNPAYTSATENTDGSWTLVWNLPDMGPSSTTSITYSTLARTNYQEGFADAAPILARDTWINSARVDGNVDSTPTSDIVTVSQSATGVALAKDVATRPAVLSQPAVCGDGTGLSWNPVSANDYRVGDQICWRLAVDYPTDLYTLNSLISDAVPAGQAFTADDTWSPGVGNTVPLGEVDGSGNVAGATTLVWQVGDTSGYVGSGLRFEVVYSTTVVNPSSTTSGQVVANVMNHSHVTTSGGSIAASDTASVEITEPEISVVKGVAAVNGISTGGANVDGVEVSEADVITYQVSVTNNGDVAAEALELWDLLPPLFSACSSHVSAIGGGGACVDPSNRVEWVGGAALTVPPGSTTVVTYDATIPSGISPNVTLNNTAGVVSFTSSTNNGTGSFLYVPSSNIDGAATGQNTTSARDTSSTVTSAAAISNTRSTGVDESGNHVDTQATIGELVTYTVTVVIPEGTTVYDASLVDDLPANLDLVSSSHTYDGEQAVTLTEDAGSDIVTVEFPDPSYNNAPGTGDDTLAVTIVARVLDIPANSRGASISSTATFSWLDQDSSPHSIASSAATTVVEPLLGISKSSVDSIGNNGVVVGDETVDYTVVISNSGSANVSTAHDLVVVDTIPEGMTLTLPVPNSGVWVPDGTPGDGIAGTITWTFASIGAGSSVSRTYQVTIDDPVVVNSTFVNNVEVDGSSMAGTPAVERTAGSGYHNEDGHVLNTPLASISRSVFPTGPTIGDVLTYTVSITMPPGTIMYDATVIETLPAGLVFDGLVSSTCEMGGAACDPVIAATEIGVAGSTTAAFFLGDIDVSSATGEERVVAIVYEVHVADVGSAGDTRTSSASVYGNQSDLIAGTPPAPPDPGGFDVAVGPSTATVTIKEPSLSIDKDVVGQSMDSDVRRAVPGETLSYVVEVTNSAAANTSDVYDLVVVDTVPEGVAVTLPLADGGVWAADGIPGNGVGGTITWTSGGPVAPGGSLNRTYQVVVDPLLDSGDESVATAELVNTADVTSYYGVGSVDRAANPTFAFREYNNVTSDQVSVELDLASVGGVVWFDIDGDGVQDSGEPPFASVDVAVTYLGLDGVASGDDEAHVVTTAADGSFLLEHLPGGSYTVVVDASDLPAGFVPSYDLDDGTLTPDGSYGPGSLAENEDKLSLDFGYTGTGSIGDTVWFDSDDDGSIGGTEYGLEGIGVVVTWLGIDGVTSGDDVVYNTATDASGSYAVSRLPAGLFTVLVDSATLPSGMQPRYDANGIDTPHLTVVALGSGEDNGSQDFGYAGTGALGDWVWLDRDGDGAPDPGEPGLSGVPIEVTWPGEDGVLGGGDDELFLTTTGFGGLYFIPNLPPGEYLIEVLGGLSSAATNTFDEDGGGDAIAQVDLVNGETHLSADFGFHGTASIGDIVWWDQNGDGAHDAGEPGISGVTIDLTYAGVDGTLGNSDDLSFSSTTDSGGGFLFADLPSGNYEVAVSGGLPAGMVATYDEDGGLDEQSIVTGLLIDSFHLTADFGYIGTGEIGDLVWLDLNADGVQDPVEPGIPNVALELVWYGGDGVLGTADDVVVDGATDVDGNYSFVDLPAGQYDISVVPGSLPAGVAQTHDPDGLASAHLASLTLGGGSIDGGQDFGYNGVGTIGDRVWFDRNGDGVFDTAEYGIGAVNVDVIWAGPDGIHATADDETFPSVTDATGAYGETNLPPGEYAVVLDPASLPAGMTPTHDEDGALDNQTLFALGHGEDHTQADFGYRGSGEIGDLIWFDANADGVRDADEPGIPSQAVVLSAGGNDGTLGTGDDETYLGVGDGTGRYTFSGLPPGDYGIEVVGPIVASAANSHDEDGDGDSQATVTLGDGETHATADFGYVGSAELGDLVWLDLDADGVRDIAEPGFPGVEVSVTWHGGDGAAGGGDDLAVAVLTTDGVGAYLASGLPDGNYEVVVTGGIPAGFVGTADSDGGADGRGLITGVVAGATYDGVDFGYTGAGTLGGTLWWDLDGDGAREVRENGFDAIGVSRVWAGFDDVLGTSDDIELATASDFSGQYLFTNLPPGSYSVAIDLDDLPPGVVQSFDPDGVLDGATVTGIAPYAAELDQSFGFRGESSISGAIWYDVNSDGLHALEEPGLFAAPIEVTYFGPDDNPGGGDDVTFTTLTLAQGDFLVPGVPSGFFEVSVDPATLPTGLSFSKDIDAGDPTKTSVTVGAAATVEGINYLVVGDSVLTGTVWNDRDGNTVMDPAEVGVAGVALTVLWEHPSGPVALEAETDALGRWEVTDLPQGVFTAEIDTASLPSGMSPTTGSIYPAVLHGGDEAELGFGIALMLDVGSLVWIDSNGNGVFDATEEGVSGVTLNLYDELGGLLGFVESSPDGDYGFFGLYPGTYSVQVDAHSVPSGLGPSWDRDGGTDLLTVVDLTDGVHILDANFGFQVSDDLPNTGIEVEAFFALGVLLNLLGVVLVMTSRAHRQQRWLVEQ